MDSGSRPLAGMRVVELAGIGPGPFCAMLLADLGAEVIRVDRPGGAPSPVPAEADVSSRGKRRIVVDLKRPRGAEVVLRLAAASDALVEGYRPGVAERLGIGPADCWARNPRLVYGRMTGWGQDGPLAPSAGHDIAYIAVTGALHAIGRAGGPPQVPVNYLGDFGGGSMFLAVGMLAAVLRARQTGRGQVVDAAIVDGAAALQAMTYGLLADGSWTDERGVNRLDTGAPFYDVYETSDGRHMAVGALEPQFYARFVSLLFAPEGAPADLPGQHDAARWPRLRSAFAQRFATRTMAEWATVFDSTDACVAPVLSMTEAPSHPHLAARGTYVEADGLVQPAPAPRFSDCSTAGSPAGSPIKAFAPGRIARTGAHTREVLTGLGLEDVDDLLADGAVWQALGRGACQAGQCGWRCARAQQAERGRPVDRYRRVVAEVADRHRGAGLGLRGVPDLRNRLRPRP
jgi:alpha-methylacyl-CoA racemase